MNEEFHRKFEIYHDGNIACTIINVSIHWRRPHMPSSFIYKFYAHGIVADTPKCYFYTPTETLATIYRIEILVRMYRCINLLIGVLDIATKYIC